MPELGGEATLFAFSARPGRGTRTQQRLSEPQGQALLSDASRSMEEHARRKRSARDRVGETLAESLVAVQLDERHDPVLSSVRQRRLDPASRDDQRALSAYRLEKLCTVSFRCRSSCSEWRRRQ